MKIRKQRIDHENITHGRQNKKITIKFIPKCLHKEEKSGK